MFFSIFIFISFNFISLINSNFYWKLCCRRVPGSRATPPPAQWLLWQEEKGRGALAEERVRNAADVQHAHRTVAALRAARQERIAQSEEQPAATPGFLSPWGLWDPDLPPPPSGMQSCPRNRHCPWTWQHFIVIGPPRQWSIFFWVTAVTGAFFLTKLSSHLRPISQNCKLATPFPGDWLVPQLNSKSVTQRTETGKRWRVAERSLLWVASNFLEPPPQSIA